MTVTPGVGCLPAGYVAVGFGRGRMASVLPVGFYIGTKVEEEEKDSRKMGSEIPILYSTPLPRRPQWAPAFDDPKLQLSTTCSHLVKVLQSLALLLLFFFLDLISSVVFWRVSLFFRPALFLFFPPIFVCNFSQRISYQLMLIVKDNPCS